MTAQPAAEAPDGLPLPQRYLSILTIALVMAMTVLDQSIANIALPTIAKALKSTDAASIWVVNAYQVSMVMFLLPMAALGDAIGYRRVFLAGLPLFALGAVGCALSNSMEMLTVMRCLEGIGGACCSATNSAVVRFTYPSSMLGRGIGFNAVIIAVFSALGPTIAGAILAIGPWQWLFAINPPFLLAAFILGLWSLPKTKGSGHRFDPLSALLNGVTWGGLLLGGSSLAHDVTPLALGELAAGVVAGVFLSMRELKKPVPLVPFDLMRIRIFRLSVATGIASFGSQMLAFLAIPFYFQGPLQIPVVQTGMLMTPWPIAAGVSANVAGYLSDRYPAGILGAFGLSVMAVGLVLVAMIAPGASHLDIIWRMTLCGVGFGFFQAPNNRTLVSSAPRERSGAAGGMLATARLLGQTIGAGVMVLLFHLVPGQPTKVALYVAAAGSVIAALVSLSRLRAPPTPMVREPEPEVLEDAV
ncbi:MFS transporter [Phenylobacterium immobile]|uniref:MFS transporter n=1 Tax=Phenylobacterium immobile TaxID=21 RepID=UPI000AA03A70|nr:MFS transporter [Phenylobacterium immobile]